MVAFFRGDSAERSDRTVGIFRRGEAAEDGIPDGTTLWLFREKLARAGLIETLFDPFNRQGYIARGGQMVDASIVPVPKQRKAVKRGEAPAEWEERPASAGIVLFRRLYNFVQVLLVHPGGPVWKNRDDGIWSIPKGLYDEGEQPLAAAKREFQEETGCIPHGTFTDLGVHGQPHGKRLAVWAVEGNVDLALFKSNTFGMEWPPRSGRFEEFPEADRAAWFEPAQALRKDRERSGPDPATALQNARSDATVGPSLSRVVMAEPLQLGR